MNKKFVYQVGNNKKSYTMMHGQPNTKTIYMDFFLWRCDPTQVMASSFLRVSRSHTTTQHSR